MKKIFTYLNLVGNIKTYLVAKSVFKAMNGEEGYFLKSIHVLLDDAGERIENPQTTNSSIRMLVPIPYDVIVEQTVSEYVGQVTENVSLMFLSGGLASYVDVSFIEKYTDDDKRQMVFDCVWRLKTRQLLLSICLFSALLLVFPLLFFIFL